jgi:hypothetical protein
MKMTKALATTMALLAFGATAHAETIYITGSTAFRAGALTAIVQLLGGTDTTHLTTNSTPTCQSNATLASANAINWVNKTYNGHTVTIKVSFFGSVGGVETTSNSIAWPFLSTATIGTVSFDPSTSPAAGTGAGQADYEVPQITYSDSYQASTPFNDNVLANDSIVGVVPFQWVASHGAPTGQSLNNHLVNAIFSGGNAALATLTGLSSDRTTLVTANIGGTPTASTPVQLFALGRDADSGTRVIALAEAGYGVNTAVVQYKPTTSGNNVTAHAYYPGATINGIAYDTGNIGYNSGGTLAGLVRLNSLSGVGGYYVTYLGKSDAKNALLTAGSGAGAAVPLAWNGVSYFDNTGSGTPNDTLITEGQYTFWSYEHVLYGTLTGDAAVFAPALAAQNALTATASVAGIALGNMHATRGSDGGYVTQSY